MALHDRADAAPTYPTPELSGFWGGMIVTNQAQAPARRRQPLSVEWYRTRLLDLLIELSADLPAISARLFCEEELPEEGGRDALRS